MFFSVLAWKHLFITKLKFIYLTMWGFVVVFLVHLKRDLTKQMNLSKFTD